MVVTFLPYPDFKRSIQSLDNKRLGKQRVEAKQLINALTLGGSLEKHPACKMWRGYESALKLYYNICLDEFEARGFKNNMERISPDSGDIYISPNKGDKVVYPWFINWLPFHKSHQASLVRKHPEYYREKFNVEEYYLDKGYIWPSQYELLKDIVITYTIDDPKLIPLFAPVNRSTVKSSSESKKKLYTVVQLKSIAKERKIKGYYKMNKDQLLSILDIDVS